MLSSISASDLPIDAGRVPELLIAAGVVLLVATCLQSLIAKTRSLVSQQPQRIHEFQPGVGTVSGISDEPWPEHGDQESGRIEESPTVVLPGQVSLPDTKLARGKTNQAGDRERGVRAGSALTSTKETNARQVSEQSALIPARLYQAFDIGEAAGWQELASQGGRSTLLLTTSAGRWLVRRLAAGETAAVFETSLLRYLRDRGYPAPEILATRGSAPYLKCAGACFLVSPLRAGDAFDRQIPEHLMAAAQHLAQFHVAVEDYSGPFRLNTVPYLPDQVTALLRDSARLRHQAGVALAPAERRPFTQTVLRLECRLSELAEGLRELYGTQEKLLTHGSYDWRALRFVERSLVQVDEFGQAGLDVSQTDLAQALLAFCGSVDPRCEDEDETGLDYACCSQFIEAYRNVRELQASELRGLSLVLLTRMTAASVQECARFVASDAGQRDILQLAASVERMTGPESVADTRAREILDSLIG